MHLSSQEHCRCKRVLSTIQGSCQKNDAQRSYLKRHKEDGQAQTVTEQRRCVISAGKARKTLAFQKHTSQRGCSWRQPVVGRRHMNISKSVGLPNKDQPTVDIVDLDLQLHGSGWTNIATIATSLRPSRPDADAVIIVAGLTGDDPKAGESPKHGEW